MQKRKIFSNTTYQIVTRLTTSAIGFFITLFLANHFGVLGYGEFTQVTMLVGIAGLVLDFGLNAIWLQREKEIAFSDLLLLRILMALLLIFSVNLLWDILSFFQPDLRTIGTVNLFLFSLTLLPIAISTSIGALFQKNLRYDLVLIANSFGAFLTLVGIVLVTVKSGALSGVFLSYVLGAIFTAFLSWCFVRKWTKFSSGRKAYAKTLFAASYPLGLMLIFNVVYFRIDTLLLTLAKNTADVGIYGLAYKFFDVLIAIPLFLSNSLYPSLLREEGAGKTIATKKYLAFYLVLSLFLVIGAWFMAPLLSLVKSGFSSSVLPFRLLLLSLPLFFGTSILQWILIAKKQQKYLMWIYLVSGLVNIVLNIFFIPQWSYNAAAAITGVTEGLVFLLLLNRLQKV